MALNAYITAVQNLLNTGAAGNLYPTATLTTYINTARNQIAAEGQCIRSVPPITGPISSITLTNGGSGYTSTPAITISGPDSVSGQAPFPQGQQATASLTISGRSVTSVTLLSAGAGYFNPIVTIGTGVGTTSVTATAIAQVSGINTTTTLQEVYPFSSINSMVAVSGSGINSIYMVNSISLIWGTFRYTLAHTSFSKYQAKVRNYTAGYYYIPAVYTQFGQGVNGSIYCYPIPNQVYQWEWDCCCLPNALNVDTDVEAIPYPWSDAVPYLAAYYATAGKSRYADASQFFWNEYEKWMKRARQMSQPRATTNWYQRF